MSSRENLRQRKKLANEGGEGSLSEPLLGGSSGGGDGDGGGGGGEEGGGGGVFDLLGIIVEFFVNIFVTMGLCSRPPPPLSEAQKLRLSTLASRASVPYDPDSDAHVEALRELWRLAFPNRALPALKCAEWKEMGWQSSDPSTDFRSGGFMSLENLVWFARHQPRVFQRLMHKQDGERSEWEYPFAAAGVNITFQLVDMLELRDKKKKMGVSPGPGLSASASASASSGSSAEDAGEGGAATSLSSEGAGEGGGGGDGGGAGLGGQGHQRRHVPPAPTTPAGAAFVDCLAEEEDAFERVYVAWFETLDQWVERRATYMEFTQVMEASKKSVSQALARAGRRKGGCTTAGLREELGLQ